MSGSGGGYVPGGIPCKYCRCEFPPEAITDKACARCLKNKQKYGNPRPCEHCKVIAAFIGMKCQKCSNSIKKYGPPIPCYVCKLKCAFERPGHEKKRAMCLMCMFKRQREKASKNAAANTSTGEDNLDSSLDKSDAKNTSINTPNGKDANGTLGPSGRCYKIQPKGYFLQTNMKQEIEYNEEGKTDLIGGWAKYKKKQLIIENPSSPTNLASNIGRGTPKRINRHNMTPGEQMIMVLDLQAQISSLNATLSQKEVQFMEKDEYWDRKMVEEKELLAVSEKELVEFQINREKELREVIKTLSEKLDAAKSEINELKEKARKAAPPKPTKKNDSDAEDDQTKDQDEVKRYGDDMDVDDDNRESDGEDKKRRKGDSDDSSDDESDKENSLNKRKRKQIDSDDDTAVDSETRDVEPAQKKARKGAAVWSDSEDEEGQKETEQKENTDTQQTSEMSEEQKDKQNKRKGAMIFSDSEDDEDQKKAKSDNEGQSDKEDDSENIKSQSDIEENKDQKEIVSDNTMNLEQETLSDKADDTTSKGDAFPKTENASSDKEKLATDEAAGNNLDKDDSNKAISDKEDSDKEDSGKEDSENVNLDKEDSEKDIVDKEDSEKATQGNEESAKDDFDKDVSEKGDSNKENSDEDSDGDLVPKNRTEKKKGEAIFSDSDSDSD